MSNYDHLQGWTHQPKIIEQCLKSLPYPIYGDLNSPIKGSGRGKMRLLYKYVQDILGYFPVQVQAIGDCTTFATAHCVNTLKAIQAALDPSQEFNLTELTSTEDLYGGERILILKGALGFGDGGVGSAIAQYISQYGTLCRQKYGNIDLTKYDPNRARDWGNPGKGPPKELLPFAAEHKVRTTSQISSYYDAIDILENGYVINVCSNRGFSNKRDKDGFLTPQSEWGHSMAILAYDDIYSRPGVLCQNSWPCDEDGKTNTGSWVSGPKRHNQPDGSFWIDSEVFDAMCKQNDTFAYSNFDGFLSQDLDLRLV